jgi:hypothetical protein
MTAMTTSSAMTPTATPPMAMNVLSESRRGPCAARRGSAARRTTRGVSLACSGRMVGNRMTSRIDGWSVSSMTSRSMPMPTPPVGGMPYSSARR